MNDCSDEHWKKTARELIILRARQSPYWYAITEAARYEYILDRCREYFQGNIPHEPKNTSSR